MWKAVAVLALAVLVIAPLATSQETEEFFSVSFKAKTQTLQGQKFKFVANGQMTWNRATGAVEFSASTDQGAMFEGAGHMVVTDTGNKVWGLTSLSFTGQEGDVGQAIFTGKLSKKGDKFNGKVTAASPTRLGPDPTTGFTLTTGKVKATLTEPSK
jgi:hypothetical protein